jgi:DNA mismatch repair protein MLH1
MVGRYAVHCSHVAFSCKKHGESSTSIAIQSNASVVDRIRQIYGGSVANELLEFSTGDDRWGFKAQGWATNANYSIKKTTFLLFINHRCVESSNIRKAIEQTYAAFLPKNGHPFVYLSLKIDPQRVDVNVHPTKREVNFLNEDEIIQTICEHMRSKLAAVDTSRTFMTQTLLPGGGGAWASSSSQQTLTDVAAATPAKPGVNANPKRTPARSYENSLVRTDTNLRKITSMFPGASTSTTTGEEGSSKTAAADSNTPGDDYQPEYEITDRAPVPCRLVSVRELRAAVREDAHNELTEVIANHTFVGIVDERRRLAAIQGGVKLFLVDYGRACYEYLYQVGLTDFANFGTIKFSPPLDLRELLCMAAEVEIEAEQKQKNIITRKAKGKAVIVEEDDEDSEMPDSESSFSATELVESVADQLIERREMLLEYFSMEISPAGELHSIPLLVKGYMPPILAKLPHFLLRLGPNVVWDEEQPCFETFLRELASFYTPEQLPPENQSDGEERLGEDEAIKARRKHVRWAVEHIFFPAFKARLVATRTLMKGGVLEIANLKGLYRVFERC